MKTEQEIRDKIKDKIAQLTSKRNNAIKRSKNARDVESSYYDNLIRRYNAKINLLREVLK